MTMNEFSQLVAIRTKETPRLEELAAKYELNPDSLSEMEFDEMLDLLDQITCDLQDAMGWDIPGCDPLEEESRVDLFGPWWE